MESLYQLRVSGQADVTSALDQIRKSAEESGRATAQAFTKGGESVAKQKLTLNDVEGALKSMSRDVGIVGGQFAEVFARGAADAAGMAQALMGGGVLGAVGLVTAAVGLVAKAWEEWKEQTEKQEKAAIASLKAQQEEHAKLVEGIKARNKETAEDTAKNALASFEAHTVQIRRIEEDTKQQVVRLAALGEASMFDDVAKRRQRAEILGNIETLNTEFMIAKSGRRMAQRDIEVSSAALGQKKMAEDEKKQQETANATFEKALEKRAVVAKRARDDNARAESDAQQAAMASSNFADAEQQRVRIANSRATANAIKEFFAELADDSTLAKQVSAMESRMEAALLRPFEDDARTKKRDAIAKKVADQYSHQIAQEEELARATKKRSEEQSRASQAQVQNMAISAAHTNVMYGLGVGIDYVSGYAQKFGDINRDNYRDLLEINANSIAAWAKYTQAFLWSLAIQSGKQAVFEVAEAGKETALAVGSFALQDYQGGALHLMSAGMHGIAAQNYAAIGSGSAGASLAIGASRGSGGIFSLTQEEREKKDRDRGGGGALAGGGPGRLTSGGGGGPAVINYTVVYAAGAVNAANDEQLKRTVGRGNALNRRDPFARLNERTG